MEGYTNIIGSAYDFDDLDIEGRVVDEWSSQEEEKKKIPRLAAPKLDEQSILSERVKLDNGQQANVFTTAKKNGNTLYICHICTDTSVGIANLRQHVQSQKHRTNLSFPVHPRAKFVKLDPKENLSLEPGEPVPPGLEERIIINCAIQPTLDSCKSALIGLEYVVELTDSSTFDKEYYYYCLLCEKTGSERNMLIHLTSIYHNLKYLSMYFPTVAKKLHTLPNRKMKKAFGLVVLDVIADIEAKYGRMKPFMEARADFDAPGRMSKLQKLVHSGPHLREKEGEYFDEKATAEYVDKKAIEIFQSAVVGGGKAEETAENKVIENKDTSGSMFNKTNRINVDKKQLRPREDEGRNSSPDVQIINIELPKPPMVKKRTRSRSLSSVSTISSSSSKGRSRYRRRSQPKRRSLSRSHRWSRSRSRSRSPRSRYHRRSPYSRRYSPRRSRDRSPYRRRHHSPGDRSKERLDRYGRSRDMYDSRSDKYRREKNEDRVSTPKSSEEKVRWEKFRDELKVIETQKLEKLRYYEKNPEKHPQYPEEWKSFWNRRYNELQRSGIDPSKHDFKPEWISFWTKRMKELYEEDLNHSKNDLRKKFDLPDDHDRDNQWKQKSRRRNNTSPGLIDISPPTPDKKDVMADIKSTWKALTGSDIKDAPKRPLSPWEDSPPSKRDFRSPSPDSHNEKLLEDMPQRKARTSSFIFVLRKLTVLEQQLGYLAPKVFDLMQQALALEKVKEEASLDLLHDPDNAFYLETVREKLIGLLCAGVVPRNMVNTARSAIKHIDIALYLVSKREKVLPDRGLNMPSVLVTSVAQQFVEPPRSDPVIVPGVGQVDKVAIAQQIATALIEQGKTNVSEAELGQLINAVVGMAEASANSSQPMTTANFLQHLQSAQNSCEPAVPTASIPMAETVMPIYQPSTHTSTAMVKTETQAADQNEPQSAFGGLKLLQSAYNDSSKAEQDSPKPNTVKSSSPKVSSCITDEELAATLTTFNNTSKEEQPVFIQKLKTSNLQLYNRLCPFIPISALISPNQSKRSPIVISISKAKSEQKIKPSLSERLSPFSSRSGGANPTVGEGVVIDIDEDENLTGDYSSKQKNVDSEKEISSHKSNKMDIDDDDDDDYSFEDVYKAAQEKLRQKQLDKDLLNNQSGQNSAAIAVNKEKETLSKTAQESIADHKPWDLESQNKSNAQKDQQHSLNREEENKKNVNDQIREIPSRVTKFQSTDAPIQYQDTNQRRPELPQNYPVREEYSNDYTYSKLNAEAYANPAEDYDESRQYPDAPYYSETASYSHQSRDQYSYGDGYGNQTNTGYGNNPSTNLGYGNNPLDSGYNNQTNVGYGNNMYGCEPYRSRQQQTAYGNNDYDSWTQNRFPNSNYPPY